MPVPVIAPASASAASAASASGRVGLLKLLVLVVGADSPAGSASRAVESPSHRVAPPASRESLNVTAALQNP